MKIPINYCEFAASDIEATKKFFHKCFDWQFTDYGPDYTEFNNAGPIRGGFYRATKYADSDSGSALIVLLAEDLEAVLQRVEVCGGKIVKPIFEFPGGRRFHFREPSGNEMAVWSTN